jgi:hypothetical protein
MNLLNTIKNLYNTDLQEGEKISPDQVTKIFGYTDKNQIKGVIKLVGMSGIKTQQGMQNRNPKGYDKLTRRMGEEYAMDESVEMDEENLDEALKTKSYKDGQKAAAKGVKYDDNPNKKGSKEYLQWSKGHNEYRAKKLNAQYEEVELDEGKSSTGYELYHKDFSSAMQHAYAFAKKKYGITISPKEIDDKVATGPKKPSNGKTNSYRLKGDKGNVQIQVANLDNKRFELNMYKEEVEIQSQTNEEKETENMSIGEGKSYGLTQSLLDAVKGVLNADNTNDVSDDGDEMDKVQPKALKKKFANRKDKDIDNDGDVDDSDEYLHKRRKAVSKAVKENDDEMEDDKEVEKKAKAKKDVDGDDKDDNKKAMAKVAGDDDEKSDEEKQKEKEFIAKKSNRKEKIDTKPTMGEAKVRGKEVYDKTFANKKQADDFARKMGGRVKLVGRVFYVFKEEVELEEESKTIAKVKEIVDKQQAMKIDGIMVDMFTASAISQIYNKVNDANKAKMDKLKITKLADIAMKLMSKREQFGLEEEVELVEYVGNDKLVKIFDKIKILDKIKIKHDSTLEKGTDFIEYVVKQKSTLRNGNEKITLALRGSPTSAKRYLYKRKSGKVSFAVGDMAASIVDIKEGISESSARSRLSGMMKDKANVKNTRIPSPAERRAQMAKQNAGKKKNPNSIFASTNEEEIEEKKEYHLFKSKDDAMKKAKQLGSGAKVITGKGKSAGYFMVMKEQSELDEAKFTDKQIKMAYGVLNDPRYKGGNLTGATKAIEKIARGLSKHPSVMRAMKATSEQVIVKELNIKEAEMTPEQEKKREEIVMAMKKKMPEFEAKYGDRAKEVMYATATKMAMKT